MVDSALYVSQANKALALQAVEMAQTRHRWAESREWIRCALHRHALHFFDSLCATISEPRNRATMFGAAVEALRREGRIEAVTARDHQDGAAVEAVYYRIPGQEA